MNILQLGKFYPIRGGVEKVMRDLAEGLSDRGVRCDMLCSTLPSDKVDDKDLDRVEKVGDTTMINLDHGGRIIVVKALSKVAGTMISPAMISYLRKHKNEYDIIHVHHPDPMAALALWLSGFRGRVIMHWHSDIVSQKLFLRFYKPLQNWLIKRADKIVGTSPVYVRESPHLSRAQDKCDYIPIGIRPFYQDTTKAQAIRERWAGKTIILSVGRLVPYKGYAYLIEAMKYLPDNFHLFIGGTGPLRDQLESLIAENGFQDKVTLLGYVSDSDLHAWFSACDLFVLPSVIKTEAFGIVQIEAMSCSKPVVATLIPGSGVSWVNKDGVSGKNVIPGDPKALAEGILFVSANSSVLGKGARELFLERYSFENMINKTIKLYENK